MITKDKIDGLPSSYGVYIFYKGKTPIYIGKAINIRARVRSHLKDARFDKKEALLFKDATDLKTELTQSDFDSVLLEASLIKKYKPKYNLSAKDDRSYLYIKITKAEKYPKISLIRRENDGESVYFGPFKSTAAARFLLAEIRRIIPFCAQKKTGKSRCFYSKLGLCDPCPGQIEKLKDDNLYKKYKSNIRSMINILSRRSHLVFKSLKYEMQKKTKSQDFEGALDIRKRIEKLNNLVFQRIVWTEADSYTDPYKNSRSQLEAILKQNKLVGFNFNFRQYYRIECFDISNLFGKYAAASMVVFEGGLPKKENYRRFKIREVKKISDYDMLKEVIRRRFKRIDWRMPDLILVDGGRPQLNTALKILKTSRVKIPVLAIAKNPDRIIGIRGGYFPQALNLIRAVRDESHRFAKKYHIFLRKKKMKLL